MARGGASLHSDGVPTRLRGRHPVAFAARSGRPTGSRPSSSGRCSSSSPAYAVGAARRRRGCARADADATTSTGSAASWPASGEVAGLFRRGDALLAEPMPDVARALARLRIEGSVLEGAELVASTGCSSPRGRVHADLRRVEEMAPLAAALAQPLADKRIERRLEQSLDRRRERCSTPRAPRSPRRGARCTRRGSA